MEDPEFTAFVKDIGMKYVKMIKANTDRLPGSLVVGMAATIEVYCDTLDRQEQKLQDLEKRVGIMTAKREALKASERERKEEEERRPHLRLV